MAIHQTTDGRIYNIREICPADQKDLVAGLAKMSDLTRYHRFHSNRSEFSREELDFLTACDGKNHIAYVGFACDAKGEETEGVAVARFFRDPSDPKWGEAAIVVIDEWQSAGLGTVLLQTLAEHCRRTGVVGWRATLIADNERAAHMFAKIGPVVSREYLDRTVTLWIDLT